MIDNYYSIWKTFNQFFIRLDIKPNHWEDRLALFVAYLVNNKCKSTTIRSYISAIRAVLYNSGIELKEDRVLLASMTRACKLKNDTINMKLLIRIDLLHLLISTVPKIFDSQQPYLVNMYRALISTAYYGLFRVGELTLSQHVIKACNVHVGENKKKLLFVLYSSKTHNEGDKPQIIKITSSEGKGHISHNKPHKYCPVELVKTYLRSHKSYINETEQFFVFRDQAPVMQQQFRVVLKKLFMYNNINPTFY